MSHQRYTSQDVKEPHAVSLKVLRLSRPSLVTQYPVAAPLSSVEPPPMVPASLAYRGAVQTDPFVISPVLNLPPSFGSAYVGETFACTLSVNHDGLGRDEDGPAIRDVRITAEMKTPSGEGVLEGDGEKDGASASVAVLPRNHSLQHIVRHELKEEGHHVLSVTVSYYEATATSGRTRTFRKLYQFACKPSLIVRTKASSLEGQTGAAPTVRRWVLEAQLENCGEDVMQLEHVQLEVPSTLTYEDCNWTDVAEGADRVPPILHPGEVEQVCFVLAETAAGALAATGDGRLVFGVLGISWRGEMGSRGYLTTGKLGIRAG